MTNRVKLSLIVPCYNEQDNVEKFYEACVEAFRGSVPDFEVVFINDGSADETWQRLLAVRRANPGAKIKLVNFSRNFGKEAAMYSGFQHATGEYVTVIDADLQQQPRTVVEMVEFLDANPDCDCVAAYQQTRHEGGVMTACKKVFYRLINSVSDIRFYPNASDFRTMRRPMADAVARLTEHHRFAKGIFSWVGFNTHYMPYVADARNAGTTSWSFIKLLKYALEGIMSYTTFPLKLPLYLCAMLCASAVICLVVALAASSATWGWACFALALSAVQMLALSMIGLYLAHVYMEEKKRPICIERDYITYEEALD